MGSFLYYGRAVDPTILPAINELGLTQAKPTTKTKQAALMLLDYLHTHPNSTLRYHASNMILHVDTDAAYLITPGAKSRIAGYYYLSSKYTPKPPTITPIPPLNAPVHVECKLFKHVVLSAAEAETGGVFENSQTSITIKHMLETLGHPQPPTPIKTDNATASSFFNKTLKARRSKSWDMRYFWLLDRVTQQQFYIYWDKGANNFADYFTKHWPAKYHQSIRSKYILNTNLISINHRWFISPMRVCSEPYSTNTIQYSQYSPIHDSRSQNNVFTHSFSH